MKWAEKHRVAIQHIQLGQHQQSAYIERYNRIFRYEWLDNPAKKRVLDAPAIVIDGANRGTSWAVAAFTAFTADFLNLIA